MTLIARPGKMAEALGGLVGNLVTVSGNDQFEHALKKVIAE